MNAWIVLAGVLGGLGLWLAVAELVPGQSSLAAAIARLDGSNRSTGGDTPAVLPRRAALSLASAAPWLPVPVADLGLLGRQADDWIVSKVAFGVLGLALAPVLGVVLELAGHGLPWAVPVGGSLALGVALFFAPDLVTRVNAAEQRADFRHALASYLDLVALERGAGAAPTEALEAAADVGTGWAFERIAAALDRARKAGLPPWDGLADLADETGVAELADLAEIAGIAGQEGARILDTLTARAESIRAEALAATKAKAGARSTTMVLPIAMLAGGFLVLLIFPDFYRLFG
jgi:Flp pilus assembly protein TadB